MDRLTATLNGVASINGTLSGLATLNAGLTVPEVVVTSPFTGSYEYTPTSQTQTIEINGLRATDDITINPIPSNYGLITWDGATLTVS